MTSPPTLWKSGFTCPNCGVEAHQNWFNCYAANRASSRSDIHKQQPSPASDAAFAVTPSVTLGTPSQNIHSQGNIPVHNISISRCYSCSEAAIWIGTRLIWPRFTPDIKPHVHMPAAIKADFVEACSILQLSPRGAAALVRVALEKLINHLVGEAVKPNDGIQTLVDRGMPERVQKMCDAVRIITNDSVHLGTINSNDDLASATKLFHLVNVIVDQTIGLDMLADEVYGELPHDKIQFIEDRKRGAARKSSTSINADK